MIFSENEVDSENVNKEMKDAFSTNYSFFGSGTHFTLTL